MRPYHKKDIDTLERVQRGLTKLIPQLRDRSYEKPLQILWLNNKFLTVFKISNV